MLRDGNRYISETRASYSGNVWYRGQRLPDIVDSPFGIQIKAAATHYFDRVASAAGWRHTKGDKSTSLILLSPTSKTELHEKDHAYRAVAESYYGLSGRMPDYMSAGLAAWHQCADVFGSYKKNMKDTWSRVAHGDLFPTHSTSILRSKIQVGADTKLEVLSESSRGIVMSGVRAMATSGPISDILFVFPNRLVDTSLPDEKAIFFSVPTSADGLHFYCRERFAGLSGLVDSLEETDALVVFNNVLIPWEHVYIYKDKNLFLNFNKLTGATHQFSTQTNARAIEKLNFFLALMKSAGELMNYSRNDHYGMLCGQALRDRDMLAALQYAAIETGYINNYGLCSPNEELIASAKIYFMQAYPRLIKELREHFGYEFFQLFSAAHASEDLIDILAHQWGTPSAEVRQRLLLVEILHDLLLSSYGTRQELYEAYYAGNPRTGHSYFWQRFRDTIPAFTCADAAATMPPAALAQARLIAVDDRQLADTDDAPPPHGALSTAVLREATRQSDERIKSQAFSLQDVH